MTDLIIAFLFGILVGCELQYRKGSKKKTPQPVDYKRDGVEKTWPFCGPKGGIANV